MKKLFSIIILLFAGISGQAQFVNGVPLRKIDTEYIQVTILSGSFRNSKNCEIDYGQETQQRLIDVPNETILRDKEGKAIDFNSNLLF